MLKIFSNFNSSMTEILSHRNQSVELQNKSMGLFLFDRDLRTENVKSALSGLT